ncbi:MAG: MBL fold metallo-hydrolase [Nitrospinota bacterium]|jgi:glyoxylase-like metal-dependent hydrolase (beta-lactamase superfamily II)|nr:MBL fold metallo-hydrolase [Nitrospinota bacterium]MDP7371257.1 MBL fold metallo-hydrolase [Nitrospinota bacterium]
MSEQGARLVELGGGVHAFVGEGGDSNAGAIETPEGFLVIDAQQHIPLARAFRAALEGISAKPFLWLILTHYHLDHTAGNSVFAGDTPVLAHRITLEKYRRVLGLNVRLGDSFSDFEKRVTFLFGPNIEGLIPPGDPAWEWFRGRIGTSEYDTLVAAPPTHTFADRFVFHMERRSVVLEYLGPAHCDGDIIVHLPEDGIVFVGDMLFVGRFPWLGDGDINGWISALDRVSGLDVGQVVPGHGKPVTLKELRAFREMLAALRDGVNGAIEAGMSEDEAVDGVSLPDYETLPRYREWMPWNVRNAYRQMGSR